MAWISAGGAIRTTSVLIPYFLKTPLSWAIQSAAVAATGWAKATLIVPGVELAAVLALAAAPLGLVATAAAKAGLGTALVGELEPGGALAEPQPAVSAVSSPTRIGRARFMECDCIGAGRLGA